MSEPAGDVLTARINQAQYAVEKLGFPFLVCIFLGFVIWRKFEQVGYKLERIIRNERAIMQKLGIPVIVAQDKWEDK